MLLLLTNSLRSLQASESTIGFERIMTSNDLARTKTGETASSATTPLGILQNALTGASVPFAMATTSACAPASRPEPNALRFNIHDLDATNVVYGFEAQEWNLEALRNAINVTAEVTFSAGAINSTRPSKSTNAFDLGRAFNMYMHGKILLDKGVNAGDSSMWSCGDLTNEGQRCGGMRNTLDEIGRAYKDAKLQTPSNLAGVVGSSLAQLITRLNQSEVSITLQNRSVTSDLRVELMMVEGSSFIPGENITINGTDGNVYKFETWAPELCSAYDCVFVDRNDPVRVPQQILVVPSYSNCSLSADSLQFLSDLRIYIPTDCVRDENAFIAVSMTTSISGDEYGNRFAASTGNGDTDADDPYIINPRRTLRMVIARYSWTPQDLSNRYKVDCRRAERSRECRGIDYELPQTGRFVFAAEDALPTKKVLESSFASPHRLVQLNQAQLYSKSMKKKLVPERLDRRRDAGLFKKLRWSEGGFVGSKCSRLMASYLAHVESNSFLLDGGASETYHSALFFLLSNGSVTDPTNSSLPIPTKGILTSSLAYVRLKGDIQLSEIRVSIPQEPFVVALAGCLGLILVAVVVLIVPSRRLEYFPKETSQAAKYIAIRNPDRYPDALYRKTLHFPATQEALAAEDFAIDELQLTHKASRERCIILS